MNPTLTSNTVGHGSYSLQQRFQQYWSLGKCVSLPTINFLGFQTGKLAYAVLVFILFLVFSTMHEMEYLWHFVLEIVVFWYVFPCSQFDMCALGAVTDLV
jgi:hypothetical protein